MSFRRMLLALIGVAGGFTGSGALAATPADEAQRLQTALQDLHVFGTDHWIYNNLENAIAEAKRTNKPIFVTFRCVPCKACAGFDAEVAQGSEVITKFAREKFVSLRQVEMKGVDLNQFQFDRDLNWAAMFINADGTVYARYGTQSAEGPDAYNSIQSLVKTMERVLEMHAQYPKNKESLAAKKGEPKPYKTGLEMPGMENREKLAGPTARNNCIHCHMIHDAEQNELFAKGLWTSEMLNRYPLPDNIGLHIDRNDGRKVERVAENSAASAAGLKPGDEITHVNGQAILSIADVQWVLHHLPNADTSVKFAALRNGGPVDATLKLSPGWKKTDWSWRGSRWSLKPKPGFWAPLATEAELKKLGLASDAKAYRVQWINKGQDEGRKAFEIGLREGDFIVAIDGKPVTMTPADWQMYVRTDHKIGQSLKLTVVRNGERKELVLPLVG